MRHLLWAQEAGGIRAVANDLRASVTADGRILNVLGSPIPDLELPAGAAGVSGGEAVAATFRDAGRSAAVPRALAAPRGTARMTSFAGGHRAALVLVATGRGVKLAWRVTADVDSDEVYASLVDAESGDVLASANKVAEADAIGEGWEYYPDAASGGTAALVELDAEGLARRGRDHPGRAVRARVRRPRRRRLRRRGRGGDRVRLDLGLQPRRGDSRGGLLRAQPGLHEHLHLGQHLGRRAGRRTARRTPRRYSTS